MIEYLNDNASTFIFIAILIVGLLAGYAGYLVRQVRLQARIKAQNHNAFLRTGFDSILTIINATLQQQCNVSEAVIRIVNLSRSVQQYDTSFEIDHLKATFTLFDVVSEHPILEQRKALKSLERAKLDTQREQLESELETKIHEEFSSLKVVLESKLAAISNQ